MLVHKRSANISILSLIIIVEISIFCEPIVLLNLGISFSNSPTFTSSKWNILLLLYFWIARMLRWFLYFKMALKTGSLMFLVTELFELNFRILSFFTILEKELFKVFAISHSDVSNFSFSVRFIFSLDTDFSESKGFPKSLIVYNIFLIQILVMFFFSFFQERHAFISLFYTNLAGFFCFLS